MLSLSAAIAMATSRVRADAVEAPPTSCPRGSEPMSSHGGPHCAPTVCVSTSACSPAETQRACTSAGLCVETRTGYAMGGPFDFDAATSECATQVDCAPGSTCIVADRCVGPGSTVWITVVGGVCSALVGVIALVIASFVLASRRKRASAPA